MEQTELNVQEKLAELEKLKAEVERLKTEKQQAQSNVLRFPDTQTKKAQERFTAAAFKDACIKECRKELSEYFMYLNPRSGKVKYDQAGALREAVKSATTKAVAKVLPQYPFRIESWFDNFFVRDGETIDLKLNRIDGRKETERPVENDLIIIDFIYNNCQIGAVNSNMSNAYWEKIDGSCTDNCRITVSFLQRECVVSK